MTDVKKIIVEEVESWVTKLGDLAAEILKSDMGDVEKMESLLTIANRVSAITELGVSILRKID